VGRPCRADRGVFCTVSLVGAWKGTAVDSQGTTVVTMALTQTRTSVSGTMK
jgi:hypothetical protein